MAKLFFHCPSDLEKRLRVFTGESPSFITTTNPDSRRYGQTQAIVNGLERYFAMIDSRRDIVIGLFSDAEIEYIYELGKDKRWSGDVAGIVTSLIKQDLRIIKAFPTVAQTDLVARVNALSFIDEICLVDYIQELQWIKHQEKQFE